MYHIVISAMLLVLFVALLDTIIDVTYFGFSIQNPTKVFWNWIQLYFYMCCAF